MKFNVVVPWHNKSQRDLFLENWNINKIPNWLVLQHDKNKEGCAQTKNKGIRKAIQNGAEMIVVLDDDCFPTKNQSLQTFVFEHQNALQPQEIEMFEVITDPQSRGTPFYNRTLKMPVAAAMGFWESIPDYDAVHQLVCRDIEMKHFQKSIFGKYFAFSGMNFSFKVDQWPWCQLIDVARFDDIWMGLFWQKVAYEKGYCFNLNAPKVNHLRQSNVWKNLIDETKYLELNETLWKTIHTQKITCYQDALDLIDSFGGDKSRV